MSDAHRRRSASSFPDATDIAILNELAEDSRTSMADLAKRVNLSRGHIYNRVRRLEDAGVIECYSIRINHARAGLDVTAVILFRMNVELWEQTLEDLASFEEVEYCALTTGEFDGTLVLRAPDVTALSAIVRRLNKLPGIRETRTSVVVDEVVRRPVLPRGDQMTDKMSR